MTTRAIGSPLDYGVAAVVLATVVAVLKWPWLVAVPAITVLSIAIIYWKHARALAVFRAHCAPLGKDLIIVYSDSAHWGTYIESQWLPRWGARAVVVNLARRNEWARETTPEAELLRKIGGATHPVAIFVPPKGAERYFQFRTAFHKRKHDNGARLAAMEAQLDAVLQGAGARDA